MILIIYLFVIQILYVNALQYYNNIDHANISLSVNYNDLIDISHFNSFTLNLCSDLHLYKNINFTCSIKSTYINNLLLYITNTNISQCPTLLKCGNIECNSINSDIVCNYYDNNKLSKYNYDINYNITNNTLINPTHFNLNLYIDTKHNIINIILGHTNSILINKYFILITTEKKFKQALIELCRNPYSDINTNFIRVINDMYRYYCFQYCIAITLIEYMTLYISMFILGDEYITYVVLTCDTIFSAMNVILSVLIIIYKPKLF